MFNKLLLVTSLLIFNSFASADETCSRLNDLAKTTFTCAEVALNAAARTAAQAQTFGTYQFVAFNTINNSSGNQTYNVSFQSNVSSEPRLDYVVTLYCMSGIDPNSNVKVELKK